MRAVVDTNVLVSGMLSASGPPGMVLADILAGRLRVQLCDAIAAEYRGVLRRPHLRIQPDRVSALQTLLEQTGDWWPTPAYAGSPSLPDPSDWPFIACALVAGCPVITGNVKHFPADVGVRVMTARGWVESFG